MFSPSVIAECSGFNLENDCTQYTVCSWCKSTNKCLDVEDVGACPNCTSLPLVDCGSSTYNGCQWCSEPRIAAVLLARLAADWITMFAALQRLASGAMQGIAQTARISASRVTQSSRAIAMPLQGSPHANGVLRLRAAQQQRSSVRSARNWKKTRARRCLDARGASR